MKNGKCTDPACKLQHVKDIKILNEDDENKEKKVIKTTVKTNKKPLATGSAEESKRKPATQGLISA